LEVFKEVTCRDRVVDSLAVVDDFEGGIALINLSNLSKVLIADRDISHE